MKYSIILPIYNADKYLQKCLNSLLEQTINDFEVILIDDGSTDKSPSICDEFARKDKRFKVIHKKNGGVSAARNTGLEISQGEWVCFVDADDEVKPEWLENFEHSINDDIDIVIQGASIVDYNTTRLIKFPNKIYSKNNLAELISYWQRIESNMGSLWTKAIRSSIVKKNNILFNTDIKHYEDWVFFTYCLLYIRNVVTINKEGYIYNHCNSTLTSKSNKPANAEWRLNAFRVRYEAAQQLKSIDKQAYWIYIEKISQLMMQTIYQIYKEKYPKYKRLEILKEFSQMDINPNRFTFKNKIINLLLLPSRIRLSDMLLSIFKI